MKEAPLSYLKQTLLKRRRTKIVATIGPASNRIEMIERLIAAGVNVFRLNMSHGEHADHRAAHERIRAAAAKLGQPIAVLVDLCGPKIRVGKFAEGRIHLTNGDQVIVTTRDVVGKAGLIPSQYEALADDVYAGDHILLDDGMIELQVDEVEGSEITCTVLHGGILKDRKGMNLPGVHISTPCLTEKDREDAHFALELGADFLALSFVREASDVEALRALIAKAGQATHVIAKIEMPQALEAIEKILEVSDGIMVARGDLGVELPPEVVPVVQPQLIDRARAKNKPVIVATQMLESMVENPRPTRAEVSDVSSAVFSGTDAVMLSAETASGAHPIESVAMMDRIARQVEGYLWTQGAFGSIAKEDEFLPPIPLHVAIARSAAQLSRDLRVRTIVVVSRSGLTAGVLAAARPAAPLVAVTREAATCRRMNLLWGVVPTVVETDEDPPTLARRLARDLDLAGEGQYILTVAGLGATAKESTPIMSVIQT